MKSPESFSSESSDKKELSPAQEAFARALLRVSGTNDIEIARHKEWRFDGEYSMKKEDRDERSTNYLVFEEGGEYVETKDRTARRCTICHQPLEHVNLVGIDEQVVQMGDDCTAKLQRFVETGEITAENPARKTWNEQTEILLGAMGYSENSENDEMKNKDEGKDKGRKRKVVASMMTWLTDHISDEQMPENIRYAIRCHNKIGLLPSNQLAQELGEYYRVTRKFFPAEILNTREFDELDYHPHRGMLYKVINEGLVQDDVPQLKRIIEKGVEINTQREERQKQLLEQREREILERIKLYEQERDRKIMRKEEEGKQLREERERLEGQRLQKLEREQSNFDGNKQLEELYAKGTIEKKVFKKVNFVGGVRITNENWLLSYEIDKHETIHVYEFDQQHMRGTPNTTKYFIRTGDPTKIDLREKWNRTQPTDQTILRYSCAQVILSPDGKPWVMLKDKPISLDQFLKEYEAVGEGPLE